MVFLAAVNEDYLSPSLHQLIDAIADVASDRPVLVAFWRGNEGVGAGTTVTLTRSGKRLFRRHSLIQRDGTGRRHDVLRLFNGGIELERSVPGTLALPFRHRDATLKAGIEGRRAPLLPIASGLKSVACRGPA